jgi:hypothetical protein
MLAKKQNRRETSFHRVFAVAYFLCGATAVFAQDKTKPDGERWRPKEGVYAVLGPKFNDSCEDQHAFIELADNLVGGSEYGCKVRKLADAAPDTIKLDVTCDDAQTETSLKEVILLKRLDDNTVFWRGTSHGKFTPGGMRFTYCPEEFQLMRRESNARDKAEAERKAAEERATHK